MSIEKPLKVVELFAGIGAQAQALENLGIPFESTVCEIDKRAYQSYCAIHGETPNLGDITKVEHIPKCDLMTYSFPCQDLSIAGNRNGMKQGSGTRSSLLWEVGRLLHDAVEREREPDMLLMENVDAILNKKNIREFHRWIEFLSGLGYKSIYKVLNAKDFGIPQNRKRCFMVSSKGNKQFVFPHGIVLCHSLRDFLEDNVDDSYFLTEDKIKKYDSHKKRHHDAGNGFGWNPTDGSGIGSSITTKPERPASNFIIESTTDSVKTESMAVRILTPKECWRLMGFPDKSFNRAKSAGVSDSQLYKQAGNSIVVNVLEAIFDGMFIGKSWKCCNNLDDWI